ncbi:MAG TPA: trypsin-like peptidase domain-containing protein [Anaerolineales bacterium]|jgi:2-alkenal reductase
MTRTKFAPGFIAVVVATLACSPGTLLTTDAPSQAPSLPPTLPAVISAPAEPSVGEVPILPITQGDLASLYGAVSPGIVNILTFPANAPSGGLPLGQGSGFVIDSQGHIVTNHHVVADSGDIEVDFASGQKAWAELVGIDPDSDLAVLKVDLPADSLVPLPLGDSDLVEVGQFVVAIGNPFGLSGTMTVGIISALGRTLDSEREAPTGGAFTAGDIIQTDAAINPGNSGGPLINLAGEVIGVNRAIRTETTNAEGTPLNAGVGFAIPVNIVRRVVPALIETGNYDYPFLGVSSLNESAWNLRTLDVLGLPDDAVGAYVTCVTPGGPAEEAGVLGAADCDELGLRPGGDLIVAIDAEPVYEFSDLLSYLVNHTQPGDTVSLTVLRDGEEQNLDVTLAGRG